MDPYKVLGLTPNASQEEVKHAYMRLAKKYHPDINQGNNEAEQRMKEINAAYDMIKNHGGASGSTSEGSYYGSYTSSQSREDIPPEFTAARNYINSGYYNDAINVLMRMSTRSAVWFYYMSVANAGLGNKAAAIEYIEKAIAMDPSNYEYANFRNSMMYSGNIYRTYSGRNYPRGGTFSNPCLTMLAINLLLSFCAGGRALWFCL